MATLKFEGEEREVADGVSVIEACEDMGLPFGCQDGLCGTCASKVVTGAENLSPKNDKEDDFDLPEGHRLPCQCTITSGTVEFSID
jgi:ferredoxin